MRYYEHKFNGIEIFTIFSLYKNSINPTLPHPTSQPIHSNPSQQHPPKECHLLFDSVPIPVRWE